MGFACWAIAQFQNFKEEDVVDQAHLQVEEEVAEEEKHMDNSRTMQRRRSVSGDSHGSRDSSREGSPMPGLSLDDVELAVRPTKLVKRDKGKVEADLTSGSATVSATANGSDEPKERVLSEEVNGGLKRSDSWFGWWRLLGSDVRGKLVTGDGEGAVPRRASAAKRPRPSLTASADESGT
eukprot:CAMPEP_0182596584 /NCGR_PEP_ID=MMETSP1324-20130603/84534_1 /TAXON_ID=236786 /ORGANISM="Florenciella sp., Strain RCC1587" /LENGTH=179 /DNA_ID=CAMNT_0024814273 /DNA_START=21 /DNA_END=561 /DNA_ORIENTATION=-